MYIFHEVGWEHIHLVIFPIVSLSDKICTEIPFKNRRGQKKKKEEEEERKIKETKRKEKKLSSSSRILPRLGHAFLGWRRRLTPGFGDGMAPSVAGHQLLSFSFRSPWESRGPACPGNSLLDPATVPPV